MILIEALILTAIFSLIPIVCIPKWYIKISSIVIIFIMMFIGCKYMNQNVALYNNGICPKCNEHYELRASSSLHGNKLIYQCPKCGAIIEI